MQSKSTIDEITKSALCPYRLASAGNLKALENYLKKPGKLNEGWCGNGYIADYDYSDKKTISTIAYGVAVPMISFAILLAPNPLFWFAAYVVSSGIVTNKIDALFEHEFVSKYKGWTLLEFAAESNQTDFAMRLAELYDQNNIDIGTNPFLKVAAQNGHKDFVTALQEKIDALKEKCTNKNKEIEYNDKIAKLTEQVNESAATLNCTTIQLMDAKVKLEDTNQQLSLVHDQVGIYVGTFRDNLALLKLELGKSGNSQSVQVMRWQEIRQHLIAMQKEINTKSAQMTVKNNYRNDHAKRWNALIAEVNQLRQKPELTESAKNYASAIIGNYEQELAEFMKDNAFWYGDEEVSNAMKAAIVVDLGGFKPNRKYLLEKQFKEDNKDFSVAVLCNIDMQENSKGTSIAAALDIDAQPQPVGSLDIRYDVFMELRELILSQENQAIKILAPCRLSELLWMPLEIVINKTANQYDISMQQHNPYGNWQITEAMFETLRGLVTKKIKQLNAQASIHIMPRSESPYPRRLQDIDKVSCGVVTVRDIEKRIQGMWIGRADCYPVGVLDFRGWQKDRMEVMEKNNRTIQPEVQPPQPPQGRASNTGMFSISAGRIYQFGLTDRRVRFVAGDCFFDSVIENRAEWNTKTRAEKETLKLEMRNNVKLAMLDLESQGLHLTKSPVNANGKHYVEIANFDDGNIEIEEGQEFESYRAYCEHLAQPRVYVDNLQIAIFAEHYKICCIIIPKHGPFYQHLVYGKAYMSEDNHPVFLGQDNEVGQGHYVALECPYGKSWRAVCEDANIEIPQSGMQFNK